MYCIADLVDHVLGYAGRDNTRDTCTMAIGAAREACQVLATKWNWNWYQTQLTLPVSPQYATGTITYVASTRTVTLTGGTFPTWAVYGLIRINDVDYLVSTRTSGTVLVLDPISAPADDIATATTYELNRYAYQLPENFHSIHAVVKQPNCWRLVYTQIENSPNVWRRYNWSNMFSVMPDRIAPGRMILIVGFLSEDTGVFQVQYKRRMPFLRYDNYNQSEGSRVAVSGTAVTGTNTIFKSDMANQLFRVSFDDITDPTGEFGNNLYAHESVIATYNSATSLTLSTAITDALTRSRYVVSSLIDIDRGPMWEYLCREAEKQFRAKTRMAPYNAEELMNHQQAFGEAREADSRYTGLSVVYGSMAGWSPWSETLTPMLQ